MGINTYEDPIYEDPIKEMALKKLSEKELSSSEHFKQFILDSKENINNILAELNYKSGLRPTDFQDDIINYFNQNGIQVWLDHPKFRVNHNSDKEKAVFLVYHVCDIKDSKDFNGELFNKISMLNNMGNIHANNGFVEYGGITFGVQIDNSQVKKIVTYLEKSCDEYKNRPVESLQDVEEKREYLDYYISLIKKLK